MKWRDELKSLAHIFVVFYGDFRVSHEVLESRIFRSKSSLSIKNKEIDLLISILWETISRIWNLLKTTGHDLSRKHTTIMGIFNVKQVYVFQAFKISSFIWILRIFHKVKKEAGVHRFVFCRTWSYRAGLIKSVSQ